MQRNGARPILLTNARVIDPSRDLDQPGDVLIDDGLIKDAGKNIRAAGMPEGAEIVDCHGHVVAPGLVDMRAFIGEPGAEHRETLASASQAAAAGGVTTIICQPETDPPIDDPATVDFVLRRARDTAIVHVLPMAALTKRLEGKEMTVELPLSRQDVAEASGTTIFTVSRVLADWERRGLVEAGRERVVIRNPHGLVQISEGLDE